MTGRAPLQRRGKLALLALAAPLLAVLVSVQWRSSRSDAPLMAPMAPAPSTAAGLPANGDVIAAAMAASGARRLQIEVLGETPTSVHLAFGAAGVRAADAIISIDPDRHHAPTAAERDKADRTGIRIFDVRFSATRSDSGATRLVLRYFVPYDAVPMALRQRIGARVSMASVFSPVGPAWAQDAGPGAGIGVSTAVEVGQGIYDAGSEVADAMQKSEQSGDWMARLAALENCARHPGNPLTQAAYRDNPGYQQQVLDGIQQARSEVQQATAMRFLNQETSVATGLVGGPLGTLTGPVASWNDAALQGIAEQQVDDIGKSVTCDEPPRPAAPGLDLSNAGVRYHMHRAHYLDFDEEDRIAAANVELRPGPAPGTAMLVGRGVFRSKTSSKKYGTSSSCSGTTEVSGGGSAADFAVSGGPVAGGCDYVNQGKTYHLGPGDSDTGFVCHFQGVDLKHGGSFVGVVEGYEAEYATCEVSLPPLRQ
jgi:hypothetical protein